MEQLKISVIVLTYNDFSNLKKNILSILEQEYTNYEIIIHDDFSNNFNRESIIAMIENTKPSVSYIVYSNDKNLGTVKNYNEAIKKSSGDIIVPLSQDDIFYGKDVLKSISDYFVKTECNVCQGMRKGAISHKVYPENANIPYFYKEQFDRLWIRLIDQSFISGSSLYFRKSFIEKIGYFDEHYCLLEDRPMVMTIIEHKEHIYLLNIITIIYGEEGVSSGRHSKRILNDYDLFYKKLTETAIKRKFPSVVQNYIKYKADYWLKNNKGYQMRLKYLNVYFLLLSAKIFSIILKKDTKSLVSDIMYRKIKKEKKVCKQ